MTEKTILYIGGFELPDKNAAAHRVINNAKAFKKLGYNIVFLDVDKTLNKADKLVRQSLKVQGFDRWSVSYPKSKKEWISYLFSINNVKKVMESYENVKIIVAYNYPAIGLKKIIKLGINKNIKIIADCTEWYSSDKPKLLHRILKKLDTSFRMTHLHKKTDGIIVISKYLEEYYVSNKNVIRIPPLVDINDSKFKLRRKNILKSNNEPIKIVYSGSPGANKDKINYIIDALSEFKDNAIIEMTIIGIDRKQFEAIYPDYSDKINLLGSTVNFMGRVSHNESLEKIKNADYSIFIREKNQLTVAGFPTKFVESISCSTPVITNDSSDLEDYFVGGSNGYLIKNFSEQKLVSVFYEIIKNKHIENKAYKINYELFHYENYVEKFKELLISIDE